MGKTSDPEKYDIAFCPLCKGNGKLPKNPDGFDICRRCGGFGLIKKEPEISEEVESVRKGLGLGSMRERNFQVDCLILDP